MERPQLLPCPFCGGEAVYHLSDTTFHEDSSVRCRRCGVVLIDTQAGALPLRGVVEKWNNRDFQPGAETNDDKLDDVVLAMLSQAIIGEGTADLPGIQAEEMFPYESLVRLHEKGFLVARPQIPINCIWLTPEGACRARELFRQMFCI